ncbi:MAG: CHAT domain-containing protein [Candidatus Krumholzibacteria bacterium]|nr:CHAT domain-containing protein [Candidatus Krumholzibacteria bacterium]
MGRQAGLRSVEALGHNNLGHLLYSLGDPSEALAHFVESLQIMQDEGDLRESIVAGQNISTCEIALGRLQAALARLRDLLNLCRREGYQDLQSGLLIELADAYLHQGLAPLAARLQREALALGKQLSVNQECESLLGLSRALAAMDSSRDALDMLRASAPRILASAAPLEQCQFRVGLGRRLLDAQRYTEAIDLLLPIERRSVDLGLTGVRLEALVLSAWALRKLGHPDSALFLLRRAHSLWETDRGMPLDPQWRELRGATANELFSQMVSLLLENPPDKPREERIRNAFALLQCYKARTLLERMHGPGAEAGTVARDPSLTLPELQTAVLETDELFLDVMLGPEQSLVFACTHRECRVAIAPGTKELAAKLHLLHELLSTPPRSIDADVATGAVISRASQDLAALLFAPFMDMIDQHRHVILAPDGALNLVPLAGLRLSPARQSVPSKSAPTPVYSRVPAAAVLARLRPVRGERTAAAGRILALNEPEARRESLSGAQYETDWLARRFAAVDREVSQRGSIDETWPSILAPYGVLHFAMHSSTDDRSPWRSAVTLARNTSGDGPFSVCASEIADSMLPARLVVLSCCESARGRVLSGEGVQGLASAFLAAGARAVLATLWPVDDAVTARFMKVFYSALAEGQTVAGAVARAQAALKNGSLTSHPFYWSGFVLIGDGSLRLAFAPRSLDWRRWAATIVCLSVLVVVAVRVCRRARSAS